MTQVQLDDATFLEQFENQTLDPVQFSHLGHLRLAWLYLEKNDVDTASKKVCTGIKVYAGSLGAHDKFHMTITDSLVRIIDARIRANQIETWEGFVNNNQDLVEDALSLLERYFSKEVLFSAQAKMTLVTPDLQPIN